MAAQPAGVPYDVREMEAQAVAWLIANRAGLRTGSAAYLKRHVQTGDTRLVDQPSETCCQPHRSDGQAGIWTGSWLSAPYFERCVTK